MPSVCLEHDPGTRSCRTKLLGMRLVIAFAGPGIVSEADLSSYRPGDAL